MKSTIRSILHTILVAVAAGLIPTIHAIDRLATPPQLHQQREGGLQVEECVPCSGGSASLVQMMRGGSRDERQLNLFSNLRDGVKDALTGPRTSRASTAVPSASPTTDLIDMFITSDVFDNGATVGQILTIINTYPILAVGAIALALVLILPLVVLEAISFITYTPIVCVLGLNKTICDDFDRKPLRRSLGSVENAIRYADRHLDDTFLQSFFNGSVESLRIPDMNDTYSNVTAQLMEIVDYGMSDGVFDIMNTVTISNVVHEIASSNSTRPYLTATILAVLPVLLLNQIETNPCSGVNCNRRRQRRRRSLSASSSLTKMTDDTRTTVTVPADEACEMEYIQCQVRNVLQLFHQ